MKPEEIAARGLQERLLMTRKNRPRRSRTSGIFREHRLTCRSIVQVGVFALAVFAAGCALGPSPSPVKSESLDQRISAADAARIKYSKQQFIYLDIGETVSFRLADGRIKVIRLVSIREEMDEVIHLVRRAAVRLEVDGETLDLPCGPYILPVEKDGLRLQIDTTSAWLKMGKRIQLSLWDAADPVVDTSLFVFPLAGYRLFSQGTQGYNEPVHLGDGDGDPKGQRFHHNYGFDLAGFEGRDVVLSPIEGRIISVQPDAGWVVFEDDRGIVIDCGHMDAIRSGIEEGVEVKRGQEVGLIGRKGPSGNYSHLHLGLYLNRKDFEEDRPCRNLNLYPWILTAYEASSGAHLIAVARPHQTAITGERVLFDGTNSVALGSQIILYRWEFSDGTASNGPVAAKVFDRPGAYAAILRIEDDRGNRDLDICRIRVYSAREPEDILTTLFFSVSPSLGLRPGSSVHFRGWPQGGDAGPIRLDFGDGSVRENYEPYSDIEHSYAEPGIYIVTASAEKDGRPAMTKLKVIVE
jgi:murein DD-endopeptidase MepM/ murein hydrolase activator NlpD